MQRVEVRSSMKDSLYEMMLGCLAARQSVSPALVTKGYLLDGGKDADLVEGVHLLFFSQLTHFDL